VARRRRLTSIFDSVKKRGSDGALRSQLFPCSPITALNSRLASGRGEALRPSFFIHPFSPISSFILSSARFILLNSYFILSSPSAIFRAFMPPPTELNAVAAPAPAKETSANAQARVALSDPRRGGDLSIGWMELN